MIVLGFVLFAFAFLGYYSGFTNTDPRAELTAAFQGKKAPSGDSSGRPGGNTVLSGRDSGNGEALTAPATTGKAGRLVRLPIRVTGGVPIFVDAGVKDIAVWCCTHFHVTATSGYRPANPRSLHYQGVAVDFGGSNANLKRLYAYAQTTGWGVEPWADSHTLGKDGTTGAHVHISFIHPPGRY